MWDAGGFREARNKRLLLRKIFNSSFEGLIGGKPEVLAQRIIVAVDAHRAGRAEEAGEALVGDEIGAVEVIVPDADVYAHDAVAPRGRRNQRAKFGHDGADVQIENSILDVVRTSRFDRARNGQLEALPGP